ncbi:MAG TPA: hypothetical protein PKA88_05020 [Polyangiaceae bacterium]|nr:hypothetical protein [Polyangiaceae bacterium]HMR76959.1 hypothetical protein [Polyangiaceae bacterium]
MTKRVGTSIAVELSTDQALVFFDWLSRFNADAAPAFEDQAEQRVLWDIEAMLEKSLPQLFSNEYRTTARGRYSSHIKQRQGASKGARGKILDSEKKWVEQYRKMHGEKPKGNKRP